MSKKTIAETLKNNKKEESTAKKSSANRKRLTIGSANKNRANIPKITKIFKKKPTIPDLNRSKEALETVKTRRAIKKANPNELVTRKGILGLNLTSTADENRKAALSDSSIEQRGSRRYRVTKDGVKVKMKKITKKRNEKSKKRTLKKFIDNDANLYPEFQSQDEKFKQEAIEVIKQGVSRGFVTED
ncbi:MAG: hypothetical protein HC932_06325 [Thermales bacterium]|nr:hypothetical protein [Thermales bacterium]